MRSPVLYILISIFLMGMQAYSQPQIFVKERTPEQIKAMIASEPWADSVYTRLVDKIEQLADRHISDPEWIVSRLAMYWKDGEHYTQCYLKDQNWDYGEGNAPVPTVRMPGMRIWNKYKNVPLQDRTPYNQSGDMWGVTTTDPTIPKVLVPYKESGHMIRGNNVEILTIAEESAFLYWLTGQTKYARMAADIYLTWLIGTYYMNPILDPMQSCGSTGGWEPGGICGYYDYEQIHDDLCMHAATAYDFLRDYLTENPDSRITNTGMDVHQVSEKVFKRFIDLGMIRGGNKGNWNINGWNMILCPILALDEDEKYPDGHGRQYYLNYLVDESTQWHDAIPEIVKSYDPITGLWPESPGYAFGTISMLLDFAQLLLNQGIDIMEKNPVLEKAALSVFPWMDPRGNIIVFGDSRGGAANFTTFERLLSYYTAKKDVKSAQKVASAINQGIETGNYSRSNGSWQSLCLLTDSVPSAKSTFCESASYSPFHRLAIIKDDDLMAIVYGGRRGSHLSQNGLALQLYGFGYALSPDASAYESYWSDDHVYHQSATGSNTIMPGYTQGDVVINAMWPKIEKGNFTSSDSKNGSNQVKMIDMSAEEKRRVVALVPKENASGGGYYVDIFRSNQPDNHYIFHNVGKDISFVGSYLKVDPVEALDTVYSKGYNWFINPRLCSGESIEKILWNVNDTIQMVMHPSVTTDRKHYAVEAPYSTFNTELTPGGVSTPPSITPTLIISQSGINAQERPFINIFEPTIAGNEYVKSVSEIQCDSETVKIKVEFSDGSYDIIYSGAAGEFDYMHYPKEK